MNKLLKTLFMGILLTITSTCYAQLDPANPPTDNLDYEEIQQRINTMLPIIPGLLSFKPICTFKFGNWPDGINDSGAKFQEAFKGYSIKTNNTKILLLDKEGKSIFEFTHGSPKQTLVASDFPSKKIQFDDFAQLRNNKLVVADNSRNALLFFKGNKFEKNIGFDGKRILFRYIDFIEPDRLGLHLTVFDSGRNKTYVFHHDGTLQWELEGQTEPCFFGNSLIKLETTENRLSIQRVSEISKTPTTFFNYSCKAGNIILDAWTAGTFGGQLAVIVFEGKGDEDNPDYARLLMIKDKDIRTYKFRPNLDFRLSLQSPYRLLMTRYGMQLLTARISQSGIEIIAAPIN